jgi:ubiquinone/menaquinone biosynthesis C-methylase UbiE
MVRQARLRYPEVAFDQGNMLTLDGIPDDSLEGAVAFYSLVHFEDRDVNQALRQMRRVLRPRGLLLVAVHLGEGAAQVERFLDQDTSCQFIFFKSSEIRNRIEAAGFFVTETIERDPYVGNEYPSRRSYIFAEADSIG